MAGPALAGFVHVTVRLVTDAAATVGAAGLPGASPATSVTVTVIVCVAVFSRVSVPLVAVDLDHVGRCPCPLESFGVLVVRRIVLNVRAPSVIPISNSASSAPPVIA